MTNSLDNSTLLIKVARRTQVSENVSHRRIGTYTLKGEERGKDLNYFCFYGFIRE